VLPDVAHVPHRHQRRWLLPGGRPGRSPLGVAVLLRRPLVARLPPLLLLLVLFLLTPLGLRLLPALLAVGLPSHPLSCSLPRQEPGALTPLCCCCYQRAGRRGGDVAAAGCLGQCVAGCQARRWSRREESRKRQGGSSAPVRGRNGSDR
jgi:hypothetical protein